MFGVLLNVGSSGRNPNGRGRIHEDFTFEYMPIPEDYETKEKVPTYRDLGFFNVPFPDLQVHLDPEFETFTYGHFRRGFGDVGSLLRLNEDDILLFYATLQQEKKWSTYIIGYFRSIRVFDCRKLSREQLFRFALRGFSNNAHLKRVNPSVDLLINGGRGSKLLKRAFPLGERDDHLKIRESLKDVVTTPTGKKIQSGSPWFRWTLLSENAKNLLELIQTDKF